MDELSNARLLTRAAPFAACDCRAVPMHRECADVRAKARGHNT